MSESCVVHIIYFYSSFAQQPSHNHLHYKTSHTFINYCFQNFERKICCHRGSLTINYRETVSYRNLRYLSLYLANKYLFMERLNRDLSNSTLLISLRRSILSPSVIHQSQLFTINWTWVWGVANFGNSRGHWSYDYQEFVRELWQGPSDEVWSSAST